MVQTYQLPPNCEANHRQEAGCESKAAGRRGNASTVFAEDLRQALRRAATLKAKKPDRAACQ